MCIRDSNKALREELKGNYQETMKKLDEHKKPLKEEWNNKMEINNLQSVSYTHLDVYKRQVSLYSKCL